MSPLELVLDCEVGLVLGQVTDQATTSTLACQHVRRPRRRGSWGVSLLSALTLLSCKKERAEAVVIQPGPVAQQPKVAEASAETCPLKAEELRHTTKGRVVALGDVHGDLAATRRALKLAGAINDEDQWIGGSLTLVQTGDLLDRGDDEQEIVDLLLRLKVDAKAAGGAVHLLNGNHEFMNAMGDFRYVTQGGFADFAGLDGKPVPEPLTMQPRAEALLAGGTYARRLAAHGMVTVVNDSVFVHGGIEPRFARNLELANHESRCFLAGYTREPPEAVMDPSGPLWSRSFSNDESACAELGVTLKAIGVKRMIVGHTPQLSGITSGCDDRVWRIDTGMASFYQGPTEVLELTDGVARVLR